MLGLAFFTPHKDPEQDITAYKKWSGWDGESNRSGVSTIYL
jgi:hypothetical protein